MKAAALQFFAMHKTLMNFTESARQLAVLSGAIVTAYFSVGFAHGEEKLVGSDCAKGVLKVIKN